MLRSTTSLVGRCLVWRVEPGAIAVGAGGVFERRVHAASSASASASSTAAAAAASPAGGAAVAAAADTGDGSLRDALSMAARAFNDLTGFSQVEALKGGVVEADAAMSDARAALAAAKAAYEDRLAEQRAASRELADLLQRKPTWSPADVASFTSLYQREHSGEAAVAEARARHEAAQRGAESAQARLVAAIRERYTAEQLWGDKVRRASTWWTQALVALQGLSLVVAYAVLEPRRREALQDAVGAMVLEQGERLEGRLDAIGGDVARLLLPPPPGDGGGGGSGGGSAEAVAATRLQEAQRQQQRRQGKWQGRSRGGADGSLQSAVDELRAATARLDAALAAGGASGGGVVAAGAAAAKEQAEAGGGAEAVIDGRRRGVRPGAQTAMASSSAAAATAPSARQPRNAAERFAWRTVAAGRRLAARCGAALSPLLRRVCPDDEVVTLSRGQAAGLAAAGAAVGGAATWLVLFALAAGGPAASGQTLASAGCGDGGGGGGGG